MKLKLDIQSLGEDGYHIFCSVKVNGKKCRALIDTGASKTVVGVQLANSLKLNKISLSGPNQMTGIQPGEMEVAFSQIDTIAFGSLKFKDIIAGLIDMKHVNAQYKSLNIRPFKLIIGGDILYRGSAVIDYKNKFLKLKK